MDLKIGPSFSQSIGLLTIVPSDNLKLWSLLTVFAVHVPYSAKKMCLHGQMHPDFYF